MSTDGDIEEWINQAAEAVGPVWPLHSFVTANPLGGFEDRPFYEAVRAGQRLYWASGYPTVEVFRRALDAGRIDPDILESKLADHGYETTPERLLDRMAEGEGDDNVTDTDTDTEGTPEDETADIDRVDQVLTKWLAAFLDQGKAHWPMPNREDGFYVAVRSVVPYDRTIPDRAQITEFSDDPATAIAEVLAGYPEETWDSIFTHHLAALPGWTGFIKQRVADESAWQSAYPITLTEYLAVRLILADLLDAPIQPDDVSSPRQPTVDEEADDDDTIPVEEIWLSAWEATYRRELVDALIEANAEATATPTDDDRPAAQFVFCIDTRSEIIRRHIETTGNYETHGYAGFFGIPMRYEAYSADVTVDACPPILEAEHHITDRPTSQGDGHARARYDHWSTLLDTSRDTIDTLKTNVATAFSFVESAGVGYGTALAFRTLLPERVYDLLDAFDERVPDTHEFCVPTIDATQDRIDGLTQGLTLDEKVEYAAMAFDLMGWERFARVVVFAGHTSETANNPFESSLDCGACAGNPGGPSARVLAAICNDAAVKAELRDRGIDIPDETVFVAGQHNTTTDEIDLFTSSVPESHTDEIERLQADLETARAGAAAERVGDLGEDSDTGVREAERRAADWSEVRPEWGLAGNAAFVIGPRELTDGVDLDGRAFLHSYDWQTDPEGDALEGIMTGPMIVTQWINAQYYFATVDTAAYGSGSKVTHNPVGNIGVYQGNGGELMTGLPHQSLMSADEEPYHQPLRLSTIVHAPVERVTDVLADHQGMTELLDNDWFSVTVVDPTRDHRGVIYDYDLTWRSVAEAHTVDTGTPHRPVITDD